jgi:hypothetical protein
MPPDPAHQFELRSVRLISATQARLSSAGLIFEKAKLDLCREEEPRFGDSSRRSCRSPLRSLARVPE